jgi:hypothetical protein
MNIVRLAHNIQRLQMFVIGLVLGAIAVYGSLLAAWIIAFWRS